jgi:hypothetical protein
MQALEVMEMLRTSRRNCRISTRTRLSGNGTVMDVSSVLHLVVPWFCPTLVVLPYIRRQRTNHLFYFLTFLLFALR